MKCGDEWPLSDLREHIKHCSGYVFCNIFSQNVFSGTIQ